MAANGDIYQIVDVQTLAGQTCIDVYFYKRTAPVLAGNLAQEVADTFDTSVMPDILAIQSSLVLHTELRVTNLFDDSDKFVKIISEAGTQTVGQDDSPFDAIAFKLEQNNGAIRNGAKRYPGVLSDYAEEGVITDTGFITLLVTLGASLILGLDIGVVANAIVPVIVKRILDGGGYRLPTNSGEAQSGQLTDALFNPNLTSQVSRKYGRGQ